MSKFDSLLIQRRGAMPPVRRTLWGLVTAFFWIVYLYLWAPLITLLLWLFGIRIARFELYSRDHSIDPFLLTSLPVLLLTVTVVLIGWAEYNRWRFTREERRLPRGNVEHLSVAASMGATPAIAKALCSSKVSTLHMDEHARPTRLTRVILETEQKA